MNLISVSSSNIESVGYENNTLYVRFLNGSLYAYFNVSETVYLSLMSASSHGKYLNAYIKGIYQYSKLN